MQQEIKLAPGVGNRPEDRIHLGIVLDVQLQKMLGSDRVGDGLNMRERFVIQVGQRQFGTGGGERTCTPGCDRFVIRNADDKTALTLQQTVFAIYSYIHTSLSHRNAALQNDQIVSRCFAPGARV